LEDLPELVEYFANAVAVRNGIPFRRFAPEALAALAEHSWPGNVRELRNVVEGMVLLTGSQETVGIEAVPPELERRRRSDRPSAPPSPRRLEAFERELIESTLRECDGNVTDAARALQISRGTLYSKLRKYGLESTLAQIRKKWNR
jgi:DNA-binding NtrC family response regulator